jgi:phosphonate transport system permease protein
VTAAARPLLQPAAQRSRAGAPARSAAAERPGWLTYAGWAAGSWLLAWAWRGAEIRPLDLWRDAGNIGTYASDFFPPDFRDWRIYLREMVVTVHIAIWGTVLAVVAAVPMGLLSSANMAPALGLPAGAPCHGRLPRHQRDGFRHALHRGRGAGPVCRRAGAGGAHHGHAGQAVLRGRGGHRPAAGGRHPRHRRAPLVEVVYGVIPQVMPLWLSFTLYRFESNVRSASRGGHGGRGRHRRGAVRGDPRFQYAQTCAVLIILVPASR